MRALITGGAGFLGSHLAMALSRQGWEVWIWDNLSTGRRENLRGCPVYWAGSLDGLAPPDLIVHCASPAGVQYVLNHPQEVVRANIDLTRTLIDLSGPTTRIVYASSSEVYGRSTLQCESDPGSFPNHPRWLYGLCKRIGEDLLATAPRQTLSLRIFNVSGVGQRTQGAVIPAFVDLALQGKPLTVYNEHHVRTFLDVRDATRMIVALIESEWRDTHGIMNLGGRNPLSIGSLADVVSSRVSRATGHPPVSIAYVDPPRDLNDPRVRAPNLSRLDAALGSPALPAYRLEDLVDSLIEGRRPW